MLRRFYDRVLALAASPYAMFWLAAVSFAEASVFPVPPDLLLIPMVLASPRRAWRIALVCTLASAAGGVLGWFIGATLFDRVALPIARSYHAEGSLLRMASRFREWGVLIVLVKGLTPIPYKIVTIAAGAAHLGLVPFVLASLATRGARFFLEAILLRYFGEPVRRFVEQRLTLVATLVLVAGIAGFAAVEYL